MKLKQGKTYIELTDSAYYLRFDILKEQGVPELHASWRGDGIKIEPNHLVSLVGWFLKQTNNMFDKTSKT
jgi:hypothetical protein